MTLPEVTSKRGRTANYGEAAVLPPMRDSRVPAKRGMRMIPFLITFGTLALAGVLGSAAWGAYIGAPWTPDATVRAYVATMVPEVAGTSSICPSPTTNTFGRVICSWRSTRLTIESP